jgi:hypothetical protein
MTKPFPLRLGAFAGDNLVSSFALCAPFVVMRKNAD